MTWLIPTIGVVYGLMVFFTVGLIARNISTFREKALHHLPTRLQENIFIRDTLQALAIVVSSLLWPFFLITISFFIAGERFAPESSGQVPDLGRAVSSSDSDSDSEFDELAMNETTETDTDTLDSRGAAPPYIHSPPYVARVASMPTAAYIRSLARRNTTEPPPAYAPYPSVLDTIHTQWLQISDRTAESYIRFMNDLDIRTPPDTTQTGSRVTIIPRRR
ncbi:hypothetical protein DHEL01_v209516 [Diaporthe helianthi]|uniref:Transmembrane protein n=1 Tax=Diaporthe helianthi TaxID=158607 RepID=A0A2P5HPA9_DIAHE|nr:hypothetical protein DHEL01_v209516 [Diaporthe helianthi]